MFKDICVTLAVFHVVEQIWKYYRISKHLPEDTLPVWLGFVIVIVSTIILMLPIPW